jgi:hypothetical protein
MQEKMGRGMERGSTTPICRIRTGPRMRTRRTRIMVEAPTRRRRRPRPQRDPQMWASLPHHGDREHPREVPGRNPAPQPASAPPGRAREEGWDDGQFQSSCPDRMRPRNASAMPPTIAPRTRMAARQRSLRPRGPRLPPMTGTPVPARHRRLHSERPRQLARPRWCRPQGLRGERARSCRSVPGHDGRDDNTNLAIFSLTDAGHGRRENPTRQMVMS